MGPRTEPVITPMADGRVSVHATTVAVDGRALVICGPAGAGKSGTAAQMLLFGATLIVDDLTVLSRDGTGLLAMPPGGAVAAIELRGIGLVPMELGEPCAVSALIWLGPSRSRLPEPETIEVLGVDVPLLRHPAAPDLPAKLMLWARASQPASGPDLQ